LSKICGTSHKPRRTDDQGNITFFRFYNLKTPAHPSKDLTKKANEHLDKIRTKLLKNLLQLYQSGVNFYGSMLFVVGIGCYVHFFLDTSTSSVSIPNEPKKSRLQRILLKISFTSEQK